MREGRGIKSSTHKDTCALPGMVAVIRFHCIRIVPLLSI